MDTMLRRRAMIASGGSTPPTPPVMIPYIRGGGDGSYIDTGITPDNTTKVIVWARNFNPDSSDYSWLFGSRVAYQNAMFSLVTGKTKDIGDLGICYGANAYQAVHGALTKMSHYHKYELSADGFSVDDVLVASIATSSFSSNVSIHLFGENTNGVHTDTALPIDICACQIYKNGTLVRDYTPAYSPSIGLYDAVSDTIFTNDGSGALLYGAFDSDAYTPLEYIECDGSQYFDTGLDGGYNLKIVASYRPTGTAKRFYYPLGSEYYSYARCCFQHGDTSAANKYTSVCYYSSVTNLYSTAVTNNDLVLTKHNNQFYGYKNNTQLGTYTGNSDSTFSVGLNVYVGAENRAGEANMEESFVGRFYHVGFGTQRNYVPAKVNGVAGMYDTYNDVFKPSATETAFTAGPTI